MKTSVIVSSMNRKVTLLRLMDNLVAQTNRPDEVIVVEAGGGTWSPDEVPSALRAGFNVLYAKGEALAVSRDKGQQAATGDVLFFLDDDIVMPNTYVAQALAYLAANPSVMAVGGAYVDKDAPDRADSKHLFARLMGIHGDGHANRLLPSGWTDYVRGLYAQEVSEAEWLFGCNSVVRATAFPKAQFATGMAAWSFLEDVFFGRSLMKNFGLCLRVLPSLRVIHDPPSSGGRISPATLRMRVLYRYILWREHVAKNLKSRFMFALGMLANLLLMIKQEKRFWVVPESLKATLFIIKNPNLSWEEANEFIFSKT
ncbi:MAG: glycosyltransferase [Bdellovibrionales bacterium]|jgi:GT2 family glycosyltransferase